MIPIYPKRVCYQEDLAVMMVVNNGARLGLTDVPSIRAASVVDPSVNQQLQGCYYLLPGIRSSADLRTV